MNYYLNAFKRYADFNGRARRKEYWMFMLFHMIFSYALMFLTIVVGTPVMILFVVYALGTMLPTLALAFRRMHDTGSPGIYIFIPVYGLILTVTEGNKGSNEYGPDPKAQFQGNSDLLDDDMVTTEI